MEKTYDPARAAKAQSDYCKETGLPHFAPYGGSCYRCGRQIYQKIEWPDGHTSGISVEGAAKSLVTGCPHCHYSFCE